MSIGLIFIFIVMPLVYGLDCITCFKEKLLNVKENKFFRIISQFIQTPAVVRTKNRLYFI